MTLGTDNKDNTNDDKVTVVVSAGKSYVSRAMYHKYGVNFIRRLNGGGDVIIVE